MYRETLLLKAVVVFGITMGAFGIFSYAHYHAKAEAAQQVVKQLETERSNSKRELDRLTEEKGEFEGLIQEAMDVDRQYITLDRICKSAEDNKKQLKACSDVKEVYRLIRSIEDDLDSGRRYPDIALLQEALREPITHPHMTLFHFLNTREEFLKVDNILSDFPVGSLAFNTPKHLYVGDSTAVKLNISIKKSAIELKQQIAGIIDNAKTQNIWEGKAKLNSRMRALLIGTRGLSVSSLDSLDEKEVPTDGQQWSWEVEAKSPGPQTLTLVLTALVTVDGKDRPFPIQTFSKTVKVDVPASRAVGDFLSRNWQFLWGTAVAPISIALWELLKGLREKKKQENSLIIKP